MRLLLIKKCDLFTSLFFIFISGVSVKSYFQDFMMQKVDLIFQVLIAQDLSELENKIY